MVLAFNRQGGEVLLIIPEILVYSKKSWETLSKDDQALMMKLAKETQQEQRKLWYEREQESATPPEASMYRLPCSSGRRLPCARV